MKNNLKVIDYLAEELKREEKKAACEAKHVRTAKLVNNLKAMSAGAGR